MKYATALLSAWFALWCVAGVVIALCYARCLTVRMFTRITAR